MNIDVAAKSYELSCSFFLNKSPTQEKVRSHDFKSTKTVDPMADPETTPQDVEASVPSEATLPVEPSSVEPSVAEVESQNRDLAELKLWMVVLFVSP